MTQVKHREPTQAELPAHDQAIAERLATVDIFSRLDRVGLAAIASCSERRTYADGERIYVRDAPADSLFVVMRGAVDVVGGDENSVIAELVSGDCFGELEFFTHASRNASALAEGETELVVFPKRGMAFSDVLASHAGSAARTLFEVLVSVAGRIRAANALIKENSPVVQELKRQVYGDKMTGLYNKTFLEERLAELLKDNPPRLSLLMFKPDNFKEINDTYGHEAGDATLKIVAAELQRSVDESSPAFRYMGNELAVVLPDRGRDDARAEAARLMERLVAVNLKPATGGADARLTFSFGAAVYPDHASDALSLIARAHALPLVGRGRGGGVILFPEDQ